MCVMRRSVAPYNSLARGGHTSDASDFVLFFTGAVVRLFAVGSSFVDLPISVPATGVWAAIGNWSVNVIL